MTRREVGATRGQRLEHDRHDVQPEEQVLAERALVDELGDLMKVTQPIPEGGEDTPVTRYEDDEIAVYLHSIAPGTVAYDLAGP